MRNHWCEWAGWQVRRYRDGIYLMKSLKPFDRATRIYWEGGDSLQLPAAMGELRCIDASQGISLDRWQCQPSGSAVSSRWRVLPTCWLTHTGVHSSSCFNSGVSRPGSGSGCRCSNLDGELAALPGLVVCQPFQNRPGEAALGVGG